MLKVCTLNVGSLIGRGREVAALLAKRKIDICCLQEVRYKNQGCTSIGSNDEKYKLWYSGGPDKLNGVGIMMKAELADNVIEVERYDDRLMKIRMVVGKKIWNIFSAYAPQVGRTMQEKVEYWERFEDKLGQISEAEILLVGGDVNGHIGDENTGYEEVMGKYGYGTKNEEGAAVLDICKFHRLRILNTYFKKEEEKRVTYKSGEHKTQIDLLMLRGAAGVVCTDCHAIPGEECVTQHRPVRASISIRDFKRKKHRRNKKIKMWKLSDPERRLEYQENLKRSMETCHGNMEQLEKNLLKTCREVCGETTGRRGRERETWWWNEEVQEVIKVKKVAFKKWQRTRNEEDRVEYQLKKREAKAAVGRARKEAWRQWSENLNTREGRNKLFRVASQMRKDKKDVQGTSFIKDEDDNILVEQVAVADRWKRYFEQLLNEEFENEIDVIPPVEGPIEDITEIEVRKAIRGMKNRRATGPSGVAAEMFKAAEEVGVEEMTAALRVVAKEKKIPNSWAGSTTIALYKGKGDALDCSKYRGLRLLEHGMKTLEKVLDTKLRKVIKIADNQFGFRPEKSTQDAIFMVRQLQEKYLEKRRKLFHVFVDLEKAFDRIPRKAIEWALRRQLVPEHLVKLVMMLYTDSKSRVRVAGELSEEFPINVGVHQGSALSPLLFILVMDEATKECRGDEIWELLYADDLVLTAETKEEAEQKFLDWREAIARRGMKVNVAKTKVLVTGKKAEVVRSGRYPCAVCGKGVGVNSILCTVCGFWCHNRCSGVPNINNAPDFQCPTCTGQNQTEEPRDDLHLEGGVVDEVKEFCYLGDLLDSEGGVERAVRMRVSAAWHKWRDISSLLINKSLPLKNRARVYDACIRSVLLYGSEGWPVTERIASILTSCDRRMLRYMAGVSWEDRLRSQEVAERCGVETLDVLLRRRRLRWFGHVRRRGQEEPLGRILELEVTGRRPRGRPKKSWRNIVDQDMRLVGASEIDALDRAKWRKQISRQTP